jgi:hypothetical protein
MPAVVVCAGAIAAGKTELLNNLKKFNDDDSTNQDSESGLPFEPLPTVGINHFNIDVTLEEDHTSRSNGTFANRCLPLLVGERRKLKHCVSVREFGGELAPAWLTYIKGATSGNGAERTSKHGLMFLVDVSNCARLAEAGVHLIEILSWYEKAKLRARVLVIFSKIDLLCEVRERILCESKALLRLDYLINWCQHCCIEHVDYSAKTGEGLETIFHWLRAFHPA